MKTRNKYIAIFFTVFLLFWGCEEIFRRKIGGFAGSYPFVETWDLQATESQVIEAITELVQEKVIIGPPNQTELYRPRTFVYDWDTDEMKTYLMLHLKDSSIQLPTMTKWNSKSSSYWLYISFYYPDSREIVHAWTRPSSDTTTTTFAFVSLSSVDNPMQHRLINRDFWFIANKMEIAKFKSEFVDRIRQKIESRKKAAHNTIYTQ